MHEATALLTAYIAPRNELGETVFDSRTREPVMLDEVIVGTGGSHAELAAMPVLLALAAKSPFAPRKDVPSPSEDDIRPNPPLEPDRSGRTLPGAGACPSSRHLPANATGGEWVGKVSGAQGPATSHSKTCKDGIAAQWASGAVSRCTQVNGKLVLHCCSRARGSTAGCRLTTSFALELASAFFTNQIRSNPGESFHYTMRAVVAIAGIGVISNVRLGDLGKGRPLLAHSRGRQLSDPSRSLEGQGGSTPGPWPTATRCSGSIPEIRGRARNASGIGMGREQGIRQGDRRLQRGLAPRSARVVPAYFGRATVAEGEKGEIDRAIADLGTAIQLDPRHPDPYLVRAAAWKHKGETDKAIADLSEAIRLEPRHAQGYHSRALLWAKKKDFEKAIDDYSQAIQIEPAKAVGYCDRGFAWKASKQYDNAIADYSEAVRLDPGDSDAYCGRGWAWREKQEFTRGPSPTSARASGIDPRDACAWTAAPWIFATSAPNPTYRDGREGRRSGDRSL